MNTKIKFYCINISQGEITKIIFETIVDGILEDVSGWVDDNVSVHYDEFLLDMVLDWVVISSGETKSKPKETKIVNTINAHLFFEDSIDWSYYRIGRANEQTRQIKKETRKLKKETKELNKKLKNVPPLAKEKDYPSVWIEPSGDVHEVGFANHEG